jgi:hypothetical protein
MKQLLFITISAYLILVDIKLINAFKMSKIQNFCLLNQNCMNNPISNYCCGYICCNMIEYIIKDGYIYIHINILIYKLNYISFSENYLEENFKYALENPRPSNVIIFILILILVTFMITFFIFSIISSVFLPIWFIFMIFKGLFNLIL